MAGRLAGGASPDTEPGLRKLALTRALLGLRIRRAAAFAADGAYQPLDVGDDAVAFTRDGQVLVCVGVRRDAPAGPLPPLPGVWRDLLGGARRTLDGGLPLARVRRRLRPGRARARRAVRAAPRQRPWQGARCELAAHIGVFPPARPVRLG